VNKAIRNISAIACVLTVLLAVPSLLSAQIPTPAPRGGIPGIAAFGVFVALVAVLGIGVTVYDVRRKHEGQALYLQASVSNALLETPELMLLPISATVHVPRWRPAAAVVTVTGTVPIPELREAVVRRVVSKVFVVWPSARIEDRIVVDPPSVKRAA
jgi:hypothetical protein